jgi:hypothetical protein
MAFVDIPTLNGGQVHVAADSVYRITRGIGADSSLTRVEFGSDMQLTRLAEGDVANLLRKAGAKLIEVTAPDGTGVFLSVGAISAIRDADPHMDPPEAHAVITVGGHRQAVRQTQADVKMLLSAAG